MALTVRPVRVVVAAIVLATTAWLSSGRPRQFMLMWENSRCSILFHFRVPGARRTTVLVGPGSSPRPPDSDLRRPVVDVLELGIPVGMLAPFDHLGVGLQPVPARLEQLAHRARRHRNPCRVNCSASFAVDLFVHRNGDCGSPRVTGSTRLSN